MAIVDLVGTCDAQPQFGVATRDRTDQVDQVGQVLGREAVAHQDPVHRGVRDQVLELGPAAVGVDDHRPIQRGDAADDTGEGERIARSKVGVEHLEQRSLLGVQSECVHHGAAHLGGHEPIVGDDLEQPSADQRRQCTFAELRVASGQTGHDGECRRTPRLGQSAEVLASGRAPHLEQSHGPQQEPVRLLIEKIHVVTLEADRWVSSIADEKSQDQSSARITTAAGAPTATDSRGAPEEIRTNLAGAGRIRG